MDERNTPELPPEAGLEEGQVTAAEEGPVRPAAGEGGPGAAAWEAREVPAPEAPLESEEQLRAELARTREELASTAARLDDMARACSALLNEQKEFRARLEREQARVLEGERGKVALVLLELGDELQRALAAASGDASPLAQGVRLIAEELQRRLSAMGIERLELTGKPFDAQVAEAVDLVTVSDPVQDNQVVEEARSGYLLQGRLLRPARVRVARYVAPQAPPPKEQTH